MRLGGSFALPGPYTRETNWATRLSGSFALPTRRRCELRPGGMGVGLLAPGNNALSEGIP